MTALRNGATRCEPGDAEAGRIGFLLCRDGEKATVEWAKRTLAAYRLEVLDPKHFASSPTYPRLFLAARAGFRQWLAQRVSRG